MGAWGTLITNPLFWKSESRIWSLAKWVPHETKRTVIWLPCSFRFRMDNSSHYEVWTHNEKDENSVTETSLFTMLKWPNQVRQTLQKQVVKVKGHFVSPRVEITGADIDYLSFKQHRTLASELGVSFCLWQGRGWKMHWYQTNIAFKQFQREIIGRNFIFPMKWPEPQLYKNTSLLPKEHKQMRTFNSKFFNIWDKLKTIC